MLIFRIRVISEIRGLLADEYIIGVIEVGVTESHVSAGSSVVVIAEHLQDGYRVKPLQVGGVDRVWIERVDADFCSTTGENC